MKSREVEEEQRQIAENTKLRLYRFSNIEIRGTAEVYVENLPKDMRQEAISILEEKLRDLMQDYRFRGVFVHLDGLSKSFKSPENIEEVFQPYIQDVVWYTKVINDREIIVGARRHYDEEQNDEGE